LRISFHQPEAKASGFFYFQRQQIWDGILVAEFSRHAEATGNAVSENTLRVNLPVVSLTPREQKASV